MFEPLLPPKQAAERLLVSEKPCWTGCGWAS